MRIELVRSLVLASVLLGLAVPVAECADEPDRFSKWESAVQQFERQDETNGIRPGGIVFVGSSSIRMWKLADSFPELPTLNRGFGGSELADSVHFAERLVLKHQPRCVVLYAGDNDISRGATPEKVASDFEEFVKVVREKLPETRIVFIAVKPSLARWKLVERMREANRLIAEVCKDDENLHFVDVDKPMLGDDGQPRLELFASDGLHLSPDGYNLWTSLVRPHLQTKSQ